MEEVEESLASAPASVLRLLKWQLPESFLQKEGYHPQWMTKQRRYQLETDGAYHYHLLCFLCCCLMQPYLDCL